MKMKLKTIMIFALTLLVLTSGFSMTISAKSITKNQNTMDTNIAEQSDTSEFYALIVGIEEFAGLETPDEEWLDESATAFYERLLSSENWKEENIKFLLNENATKENIHDAIVGWLDDKENESDTVLIYYADHGWKMPLDKRRYGHAYVFTHNATDHYFGDDKISDKEFDSWVDELDSKHIVMILDHCYSGRMFALRQLGRTILAAGGKYLFCPANWSDQLKSSIFTYYLLEGLDGVADLDNDGWITAKELFRYARFPVIWYSTWNHFPYFHPSEKYVFTFLGPQVPFLYDYHIGKIPLIKL